MQVNMFLRVWSINNRSKAVLWCLSACIVIETTALAVIWGVLYSPNFIHVNDARTVQILFTPRAFIFPTVPPMLCFQTVLLYFTLRGAAKHLGSTSRHAEVATLRDVLLHDGIVFFLVNVCMIIAALSACLVVDPQGPPNAIILHFITMLEIVLGTRLVVNIRKFDAKMSPDTTFSQSDVVFAHPIFLEEMPVDLESQCEMGE